jgi:hypothetical protein
MEMGMIIPLIFIDSVGKMSYNQLFTKLAEGVSIIPWLFTA